MEICWERKARRKKYSIIMFRDDAIANYILKITSIENVVIVE